MRRLRVVACRNRHCLLFGVGWPSVAMGTGHGVYVYLGPLLLTVSYGARN